MKKMVINQEHLKPALKKLSQAISSKTVLPALSNLYCRVGKTEVELITSDLELTILYRCPCESTGAPFELLLPFEFVKKIVGFSGSMPISIEQISAKKAIISAGQDVFEVNSLDKVADFPKIPDVPKKNSLLLGQDLLAKLYDSMETCGKDEQRPSMMHSCLDITEGTITVVSTDAVVLYTYKIPIEGPLETGQILISPKIAHALDGVDKVEMFWHSKQIAFKTDSLTIIATRHEEKYPNYRVVIPNHGPNLSIYRNDLISALEKTRLASDTLSTINLKKEAGSIMASAHDQDLDRKVESIVPGRFTGTADYVSINPKKLITLLHQIPYDQILLHIDTHKRAVLISSEEDSNYLGMIMPSVTN